MTQGTLFMVSAPSGAGKTSLLKALLEQDELLHVSASFTTRPKRSEEVEGRDYHFVDFKDFLQKVEDGSFLEHAKVFDNYYGTDRKEVFDQLEQGFDVILEIDWQGARQIRSSMSDTISIFILPPSEDVLHQRLLDRGQDGEDVIQRRMYEAKSQISHFSEFDYLVVNEDFSLALEELRSIVRANRLRQERMAEKLQDQLAGMLG
ncbi:MAG: guanylate kinase [Gammaproteobacteria bacterium]|jgi:guanylate kinase